MHSKLAALQEQARRRHNPAPLVKPAPDVEPRAFPKFRTTSEVAEILRISQKSVIREFEGGLGVIDNGSPRIPTETDPRTKYRRLVIPEEAVWQYLAEHRSI